MVSALVYIVQHTWKSEPQAWDEEDTNSSRRHALQFKAMGSRMSTSRYWFVMWISFVQRLLAEIVANRIHKTCGTQVTTVGFGYPGVFWVTFYWATGLLEGATAMSEDTTDPLVILFADIVSRVEFLDVVSTLGVPETTKNLVKESDRAGFYQIKFCEGFCRSFHMVRCRAAPVSMAVFADDTTANTRSSAVEHTKALLAQPSTSGTSPTPGKAKPSQARAHHEFWAHSDPRNDSLDAFVCLRGAWLHLSPGLGFRHIVELWEVAVTRHSDEGHSQELKKRLETHGENVESNGCRTA